MRTVVRVGTGSQFVKKLKRTEENRLVTVFLGQSVKEHSVKLSRNGKIYATVEKTSKTAEKVRAVPAPCC